MEIPSRGGGLVKSTEYITQEPCEILLYNDTYFIESSSFMSAYSKEDENFRLKEEHMETLSGRKTKCYL